MRQGRWPIGKRPGETGFRNFTTDDALEEESSFVRTAPWDLSEPWRYFPSIFRPGHENIYYFTRLAIELNEPESGVAPTDSRLRPDQRLMEEGKWDEANTEKLRLEEKQRAMRRKREAEAEQAMLEGERIK